MGLFWVYGSTPNDSFLTTENGEDTDYSDGSPEWSEIFWAEQLQKRGKSGNGETSARRSTKAMNILKCENRDEDAMLAAGKGGGEAANNGRLRCGSPESYWWTPHSFKNICWLAGGRLI